MNDETLLLRQIHPTFVQGGRVTSQAFRPTPKDESKLSVYDGDMIDAEAAYAHYTTELALGSVGVLAIKHAECLAFDLPVEPDSVPFPEHAFIDFTAFEKKQIEKKAKLLKAKAVTRGWLYMDDSSA